ncbi:MAG: hypothetical protein IJ651_08990 [Bacteroidales bacterium]|nr:hypothetical protein [Bacteroidales bacterium]
MKKLITKFSLVAGLLLLSCITALAQYKDNGGVQPGRLYYTGKGDFSMGGNRLSEEAIHDLIGEQVYYDTYLGAQKQRRVGLTLGWVGAGLLAADIAFYAALIDSPQIHERDVVLVSSIVGSIGAIAGAGFVFHFIGKGRLKWIADDYNRRNGYAASWRLGPTRSGLGVSLNF